MDYQGIFAYHTIPEKGRRNIQILELLSKSGPISKKKISEETQVNHVSISNYINNLEKKGIILDKGQDASTGGRRPELYDICENHYYVIGVYLNKRECSLTLTDLRCNVVKNKILSYKNEKKLDLAYSMQENIKKLLAESQISVESLGFVGLSVDEGIFDAEELKKKKLEEQIHFVSQLQDEITQAFNTKVFYTDPATCAGFAEKKHLDHADDLLYVHSDLGYGVVIKGDIYCGAWEIENSFYGNVYDQIKKKHGSSGNEYQYLKPWGKTQGIVTLAKEIIKKGVGTKILELANGDLSQISLKNIIKAANDDDDIARDLLEGIGARLGIRIAYLINLFSPKLVIVGGGIEEASEYILRPIRETADRLGLKDKTENIKITLSTFGSDAVSFGAARLAVREIFIGA